MLFKVGGRENWVPMLDMGMDGGSGERRGRMAFWVGGGRDKQGRDSLINLAVDLGN